MTHSQCQYCDVSFINQMASPFSCDCNWHLDMPFDSTTHSRHRCMKCDCTMTVGCIVILAGPPSTTTGTGPTVTGGATSQTNAGETTVTTNSQPKPTSLSDNKNTVIVFAVLFSVSTSVLIVIISVLCLVYKCGTSKTCGKANLCPHDCNNRVSDNNNTRP
jgi:hypothetical protein